MSFDAVPTALPDEETTAVDDLTLDESDDATPDPLEHEPTRAYVRDWLVQQDVRGRSTIQIPLHVVPTQRVQLTAALEAVPEPIDEVADPEIEQRLRALCVLIQLAEMDGWNGPGYDPQQDTARGGKRPVRRPRPYDETAVGRDLHVMRTYPEGRDRPAAIRFLVSDWPLFRRWMRQRVADQFAGLRDLTAPHREFLLHFYDTLKLHRPAVDNGQHVLITVA